MNTPEYIRLYEQAPTSKYNNTLDYWVDLYFSNYPNDDKACVLADLIKNESSVVREFARYLDITDQAKTIKIINQYIPYKPKNIKHKTYILASFNMKHCTVCKLVLSVEDFNNNKTKPDGKAGSCKYCNSKYIKADSARYRALSAQKRQLSNTVLSKKYRNEILIFYENCPETHHVDHIVPINGETVCGLHVPWNLQYLTKAENLAKRNKYNDW